MHFAKVGLMTFLPVVKSKVCFQRTFWKSTEVWILTYEVKLIIYAILNLKKSTKLHKQPHVHKYKSFVQLFRASWEN